MYSRDIARPCASKPAEGRCRNRSRDESCRSSEPPGLGLSVEVMLLFGAGVLAAAAAQSAAAAGWSIQPVPKPANSGDTELSGVSCTSTRDCVAVGWRDVPATDNPVPLVERWNGSTWSTEHTPMSTASGWSGWLSAVSCASSSACVAVGLSYSDESSSGPFAERWDGSSWSIERIPQLLDAEALDGVSCASSTDCTAVGYGPDRRSRRIGTALAGPLRAFISATRKDGQMRSLACRARRAAAPRLVGTTSALCRGDTSSFYSVPVLGFWTDRSWSLRRQPNLVCSNSSDTDGGYTVNGVSCTSRTACTAVGTAVYRWEGHRWSIQPAPIGADGLSGVSCTSTNACTAVGSRIYTWNGLDWSSVRIPRPAEATAPELTGVSCPSRGSCVAVGSYLDRAFNGFMLVDAIGIAATPVKPERHASACAEG